MSRFNSLHILNTHVLELFLVPGVLKAEHSFIFKCSEVIRCSDLSRWLF
jgi:hypothetical protein